MSRPCNVGPKQDVDIEVLVRLLLNYIDGDAPEVQLFELGSYASKHAGCGLDYAQLAVMAPMIPCFLGVAAGGYVKKTEVRKGVEQEKVRIVGYLWDYLFLQKNNNGNPHFCKIGNFHFLITNNHKTKSGKGRRRAVGGDSAGDGLRERAIGDAGSG